MSVRRPDQMLRDVRARRHNVNFVLRHIILLDDIGSRPSAHHHDFVAGCIALALDYKCPTHRCFIHFPSIKGSVSRKIFLQSPVNIEVRLYPEGAIRVQKMRSEQLKIIYNFGAIQNRKVAPPNSVEETVSKLEASPS